MSTEERGIELGFAARIQQFISTVEYRRIESSQDLEAVERLRYAAYLKEGAIAANVNERLIDRFDEMPNAINVGLYHEGTLVSALRLHILGAPGMTSPGLETFPDLLAPYIMAGKRIVDPGRFVVDYKAGRMFHALPYATLRLIMMAADHYRADLAALAVRVEHQAFYRRYFLADSICPARDYPGLIKPLTLMLANYQADKDRILQRSPFFASLPPQQSGLFANHGLPEWALSSLKIA